MIKLTLLALALGCGPVLQAATDKLDYALSQLPGNGPASFAKILLPRQPDEAKRLATELVKATGEAGTLLDHELITSTRVSTRLERFVIALHYERRPIFLRVDRYVGANEEWFLNASVLTAIDELLPNDALLGRN